MGEGWIRLCFLSDEGIPPVEVHGIGVGALDNGRGLVVVMENCNRYRRQNDGH